MNFRCDNLTCHMKHVQIYVKKIGLIKTIKETIKEMNYKGK